MATVNPEDFKPNSFKSKEETAAPLRILVISPRSSSKPEPRSTIQPMSE